MKNLDTVDVEKLEKLSFLVNNHGLAVVLVLLISITAIPALIILLYRNLTELKKTQYATIKILEKMMLNYKWDDETFKSFAKYAIIDIRWNVQIYIIEKDRFFLMNYELDRKEGNERVVLDIGEEKPIEFSILIVLVSAESSFFDSAAFSICSFFSFI